MEDLLEKGMATHSRILAWRISCHLDATSIKALLKRHPLQVSHPFFSQCDSFIPQISTEHLLYARHIVNIKLAAKIKSCKLAQILGSTEIQKCFRDAWLPSAQILTLRVSP